MNTLNFKKGLGRGLSSLLGDAKSKTNFTKLKIYDVKRNRLQPRKIFNKENLEELTNSIKERGVIQPIIVRKDKSLVGKFEIIAGERRWLASQNAGLHEIPVVILDVDDQCINERERINDFQDDDGCPDINPNNLALDTDGDGIRDTIDMCPYAQETFNNILDTDGCPDGRSTELFIDNLMKDSDHDGLIDAIDKCISLPETFNNY